MNQPVYSIVVPASNADYGGKFLQRFQKMIDDKARFAFGLKPLTVELIVVEWNPPPDRPRLKDVITFPSPLHGSIITVPKEMHQTFYNPGNFSFLEYMAKNVGIRRATGLYILSTNADVIFSDGMHDYLRKMALSDYHFYRANRHDMDDNGVVYQICYANGVFAPGENVVGQSRTGVPYYENMPHFNAAGDFMLMTRANWHRLRGYPENTGYLITLDGEMVHIALTHGLQQVVIPHPLYHQCHTHSPVKPWYMPPAGWHDSRPRGTVNASPEWGLSSSHLEVFEGAEWQESQL